MSAKITSVWMIAILFAAWYWLDSPEYRAALPGPPANSDSLLPRHVGDYWIRDTWLTKTNGGRYYEVGGLYSPANAPGNEIEMIVVLNMPNPHDSIYCQLVKGENISWRAVKRLKTADSTATFDVALIKHDDGVELLASTNCWSKGCDPAPEGTRGFFAPPIRPISWITGSAIPVPLTVSIEADHVRDQQQAPEALIARLQSFVGGLQSNSVYEIAKRAQSQGSERPSRLVQSSAPRPHQ